MTDTDLCSAGHETMGSHLHTCVGGVAGGGAVSSTRLLSCDTGRMKAFTPCVDIIDIRYHRYYIRYYRY